MTNYTYPLFMQVKAGAAEELHANLAAYLPQKLHYKILIMTTEGLLKILRGKVDAMLRDIREYEIITVPRSSFDFAVEAAKKISMEKIGLVIGFGGGTALDTAKYAAFVASVPYIAVPTALSNDGICSPVAVLYAQNERKHSFTAKIPDGLLVDTDIILKTPRVLLEAGVGDTVSNYTALYDWQLGCKENGDKHNDFAYMLSETAFNALLYSEVKNLDTVPGLRLLTQSLVLSGIAMQLAGNSRPCSGSEHLFCHSMDELFDHNVPHGILVGMGSIVSCILQGRDPKVLFDFLHSYHVSVNPSKRGVSKKQFVEAWLKAQQVRPDRYTVLNTIKLRAEPFAEFYDLLCEKFS